MTQINFTVSSTRDAIDVRWGGDYESSRFHVKLHSSGTRTERNPCLIYVHGGGAAQNDGRLPFIANGNGNAVFAALQADTDIKTVLVGFTAQQHIFPLNDDTYPYRRVDQLGNGHSQGLGWTLPNGNEPLAAGALFEQLKVFIMVLKSRADEYGIDPDKIFLMGSSFGGVRCMLSQLTGPLYSNQMTTTLRDYYGLKPGVDSTVRGIINHYGCVDFRENTAAMLEQAGGFGYSGAADWAGRSINDPIFTQRYTGVATRAQLWALPAWHKEQLSLLWYMEQNSANLRYLPPVYHLYEFIGQEYATKSFTASTPVNIVGGGSGYGTSLTNVTISIPGGSGTAAKLLISTDGSGAITSAVVDPSFTGVYNGWLPGQTAYTNTFADVTPTWVAGDTASAGTGASVNFNASKWNIATKTSSTLHGGLMFWLQDPHDDVLMRMVQKTAAQYNDKNEVKFRYCTPTPEQMVDSDPTSQATWTGDILYWMKETLAGRIVTGPGPIYYGDYYSKWADKQYSLPTGYINP